MNQTHTQPPSSLLRKTSAVLFCCLLGVVSHAQQKPPTSITDPVAKAKAESWLKDDRTGFVENKGQIKDQDGKTNHTVKYLLNMQGLNVQLRATGFSYDGWVTVGSQKSAVGSSLAVTTRGLPTANSGLKTQFHRVDIELDGANADALMITQDPLVAVDRILDGPDTYEGIHSYKKIIYKNIYKGIDLEFLAKKGTDKPVEYNFIVHPGADATQIKMHYKGASDIVLKNGEIEMKLAFGTLKERIPASYVEQTGQNVLVQYKAEENATGVYAFNIPSYDRSKTLIIDPTPSLVWATYLGGTEQATAGYNEDEVSGVRVDNLGNVLVSGVTSASTNSGIATSGAYQTTYVPTFNKGYLVKYTSAGVKTWGTYIGGNTDDYTSGLVLDDNNNIYVGMWTVSTNMQTSAGVHQPAFTAGPAHAEGYVIKFSPAGSYVWGTYVGGTNAQVIYAINILPDGNIIVGGITETSGSKLGFGTGYKQTYSGGSWDGFVVKLNAATGAGLWGTLFGGPGDDYILGVTGDASGNV